jgi:DNA-binding transcriptional ArsR family regulator
MVRIALSAAVELSWLVIACSKRNVVLDLPSRLTERADGFWDDGLGVQPELLVLAGQLGCLTGAELGPLLALDRVAVPPPPAELPLATEPADVHDAVQARLARLHADAALHRAYSGLLRDIWDAAGEAWRATGRSAVERAAARLQASVDHGTQPWDLIPEQHLARREPYDALTRAALAARTALLTPTYFAGQYGHVIDLPGAYSIAIGTGVSPDVAARRTRAEQVATGLKLLADPTRLLILTELEQGEATVGDLARTVGVSQPTASVHVKQLREAGLLVATRDGASVRYRADGAAIGVLLRDAGAALGGAD